MPKRTGPDADGPDDFLGRMYRRLVGATVKSFLWDGDRPAFLVTFPDGSWREVQVWMDPEGNGPGFIAGLDD